MNKDSKIQIMGIVNLTDDSYFAQSRCSGVESALERVDALVAEGADILDFGACSTRPGAVPVGPVEEWRRLEPVLKAVRERYPDVPVSVDTWWSEVVSRTYDTIGDFIVNDISAGEDDRAMLETVGRLGLAYIAMHKRGSSMTMQQLTGYDDVVGEVIAYFEDFAEKALRSGVRKWILDPGFGFAKTLEQNYQMLSRLDEFRALDRPVLVGVSRKSMIYRRFDISPEESLPATQVLHYHALLAGADMLRVHDVAEAVRTVSLFNALN